MTREEVMNSIGLKKRFCKDCNLPITVFESPYFEDRLHTLTLLKQYEDSVDKFESFVQEMGRFPNEQAYFEYYNIVKETAMSSIKDSPLWQKFTDIKITGMEGLQEYVDRNLYIEDNNNHSFVSIDIRKANFTVLRQFCDDYADETEEDMLRGFSTWEEFIGDITDCRHIIESKYIRQVIFGNCNPKKQMQYERYLMKKLAHNISASLHLFGLQREDIFCVHNDEIIINADAFSDKSFDEFKEYIKNDCATGCIDPNRLKVEWFTLRKIPNTGGWIKVTPSYNNPQIMMIDNDTITLKGVDSEILPQIIKYKTGNPIGENDLVFTHNGTVARFLKPIPNPFE